MTVISDGQWPRTVKVVEMKRTDGSFVPFGFSRTGIERLKTWSGKCEGLGGGGGGAKG